MKHHLNLTARWMVTFLCALAIAIIADVALVLTGNRSHYIWGDEVLGYWPAFGAVWFLAFTGVSKLLGHYLIQRCEDFYRDGDAESAHEHPAEEERTHG